MDRRVLISAFRFQIVTMILSIIAVLLLIAETYLAEKGFYARTWELPSHRLALVFKSAVHFQTKRERERER